MSHVQYFPTTDPQKLLICGAFKNGPLEIVILTLDYSAQWTLNGHQHRICQACISNVS